MNLSSHSFRPQHNLPLFSLLSPSPPSFSKASHANFGNRRHVAHLHFDLSRESLISNFNTQINRFPFRKRNLDIPKHWWPETLVDQTPTAYGHNGAQLEQIQYNYYNTIWSFHTDMHHVQCSKLRSSVVSKLHGLLSIHREGMLKTSVCRLSILYSLSII